MTINDLKKKKYQILISLFCLCYALGTQEIKAATEAIEGELKITDNGGQKSYTMDPYQNITLVKFENGVVDVDIFIGKNTKDSREDIFIITEKSDQNKVKGYQFRKANLDKVEDDFKGYCNKSEQSYIFLLSDDKSNNLNLYYNSVTKNFIQVQKAGRGTIFYQAMSSTEETDANKPNSSPKIQIWETSQTDNTMTSWELNSEDIKHINNSTPSSNWLIFRTLTPQNKWIPYFKVNPLPFALTIFAIVAIVCCALFHKEIENKLRQLKII